MRNPIPYIIISVLITYLMISGGCEHRITPPEAEVTRNDTNYVEISPAWDIPGSPRTIIIGNDQLIYVADYDSNKVLMMDASGMILKSRHVPHPISIAQDSKLNLFVGGENIAPNGKDTIGAIYKISVARWDSVFQTIESIDSVTGDTLYKFDTLGVPQYHDLEKAHMEVVYQEPGRPKRRYLGIGILPGNKLLVARNGPNNESLIDPDNIVMRFNINNIFETRVGDLVTRTSNGTAINDIVSLNGLMIFPSTSDFILTQNGNQVSYGVVWMVWYDQADFQGWQPKFNPTVPSQAGVDFIRENRFKNPMAAAYDKTRREIFIVDAELDSVIKFNKNGQFRTESFGRIKAGLNHPSGVAYSNDKTLYIADTGNKKIRRFRLSTQL